MQLLIQTACCYAAMRSLMYFSVIDDSGLLIVEFIHWILNKFSLNEVAGLIIPVLFL